METPGTIIMLQFFEVVFPTLSVSKIVKENDPAADGVPEITPFVAIDSPVGRLPADFVQVYGATPPNPDKVSVYAIPTSPLGSGQVVRISSAVANRSS